MWTLCKTTLQRLVRWEIHWLRKVFRLRRHPDEGLMLYNRRTYHRICLWFEKHDTNMLHQRVLRAVHGSAQRERVVEGGTGEKLLQGLRSDLNRVTWKG